MNDLIVKARPTNATVIYPCYLGHPQLGEANTRAGNSRVRYLAQKNSF